MQLKNVQLDKKSLKVKEIWTNIFTRDSKMLRAS